MSFMLCGFVRRLQASICLPLIRTGISWLWGKTLLTRDTLIRDFLDFDHLTKLKIIFRIIIRSLKIFQNLRIFLYRAMKPSEFQVPTGKKFSWNWNFCKRFRILKISNFLNFLPGNSWNSERFIAEYKKCYNRNFHGAWVRK